MTNEKIDFTPAKAGDVIVLIDWTRTCDLKKGWSDWQERICLAKVTKVDDAGYVQRIKIRPDRKAEKLGSRAALVLHADDKLLRRLHVRLWKACSDVWDHRKVARHWINVGLATMPRLTQAEWQALRG